MKRSLFSLSLMCLLVSGCSVNPTNSALGSFEYQKKSQGKPLEIPEGLSKPKPQDEFSISDNAFEGPVGSSLDIRSPSLVLPIAASSRLEQNSAKAIIWFDQVLDDVELYSFIVKAIEEHLKTHEVELVTVDEAAKSYQSTWFLKEKETGMWLFSEVSEIESVKYNYQFQVKPHGRSVGLEVELAGFMKTDQRGGSMEIGAIDKQRAEMNMLNNIIAQVDYKYRIHQHENRLLRSNQKLVTIGENSKGEASFIVEMERDQLWSNMPSFFDNHGFKVTDLNEPKKTYFVDFVQPDNSIWDKIWGDEVAVIEIENNKYSFTLREHGEEGIQTAVTIYREDGTPLPKEIVEQIFPVLNPGLSFRNVF